MSLPASVFLRVSSALKFRLQTWKNVSATGNKCQIQNNSDNFVIKMEIPEFKPEEIKIEISGDTVVVQGSRQDTDEGGIARRTFTKTFKLPWDVNLDSLATQLTSGMFHLKASKVVIPDTETSDNAVTGERSSANTSDEETPHDKFATKYVSVDPFSKN